MDDHRKYKLLLSDLDSNSQTVPDGMADGIQVAVTLAI